VDYKRLAKPDERVEGRRDYFLAVLSGILFALSFPKADLSLLAWFSFVPLLLAIAKKRPGRAFRLGLICGLTAYGGILYWLNIVMTLYGKLPFFLSVLLYLVLVGYLALYVGIISWAVRKGELTGITPLISFPILWVGFEYLRSFLMTGFPWASLGYSQYRVLPLIQIADITGVYGLSFLIALANVVLLWLIRGAVMKGPSVYPTKSAALLFVLLLMTLGYGFMNLNSAEKGAPLKVALVQGNIAQDVKWDPAFQESTIAVYEKLTHEACAGGVDLVVWPESAIPFYFQDDTVYASRVKRIAASVRGYLLAGSPAYDNVDGAVKYRNSAFLLSPTGKLLGRSDKIHLVPFGEYVPLARFIPFVHKLVVGIGDFSPGAGTVPLSMEKGKLGALVCFEGIFPELSRGYVRAGSRLLVNITNDAWYGRSSAPYQHLSMSVFRAVENRVPLVRAANTGITAIIDSRGHFHGMTQLFKEAYLTGEVRMGEKETIYSRYGDIFAGLCLVLSALILVPTLKKHKKGQQLY
jgi:apolipoprotein N-acyltransferase